MCFILCLVMCALAYSVTCFLLFSVVCLIFTYVFSCHRVLCLPTLWTTVNSRRHARLSINLRTCLNWMESHLWFTGNNHKIGGGSHSSSSQTERKRPKKEWVKSKVRQTHFSSRDISSNPLFWLLYISQLANLRTCSFLCRGIDTSVSWALIVFLPRDCYNSTLRTTSFLRHLIIIKVFRALLIFFFIWLLR